MIKNKYYTKGLTVLRECQPTLEEAQNLVGGYIELIQCKGFQILVDEDGRAKKLHINHNASAMAGKTLVGPALVLFGDAQWVPEK